MLSSILLEVKPKDITYKDYEEKLVCLKYNDFIDLIGKDNIKASRNNYIRELARHSFGNLIDVFDDKECSDIYHGIILHYIGIINDYISEGASKEEAIAMCNEDSSEEIEGIIFMFLINGYLEETQLEYLNDKSEYIEILKYVEVDDMDFDCDSYTDRFINKLRKLGLKPGYMKNDASYKV